jgi:hypothetical protein
MLMGSAPASGGWKDERCPGACGIAERAGKVFPHF